MAIASSLFFMWGFLTCLNDILLPHLKSIFDLTYAKAMLVQVAFFTSYVVFALPAGKVVAWRGYKQTMVIGLIVMAAGAFLFLPAAKFASFPLFLGGLVVLAAGITGLQVAANPYVTTLGPEKTASSRLNLAQAFNSLGTTIAPAFGAALILRNIKVTSGVSVHTLTAAARETYRSAEAQTVILPYLGFALALVLSAVALALVKLPSGTPNTVDYRPDTEHTESLLKQYWLVAAAVGIFLYVGAEVSVGSLMISFLGLPNVMNMPPAQASHYVSLFWAGALLGRLSGSFLLQRLQTGWVIAFCAIGGTTALAFAGFSHGGLAMWSIISIGLFNSVMFPSIFALGIAGLGKLTSKGSSLITMANFGGAVLPFLIGRAADSRGLQHALLIPLISYLYLALFGIFNTRRGIAYTGKKSAS